MYQHCLTWWGGLRSPKAWEFEKWGLKPSSLIEVYAYEHYTDPVTRPTGSLSASFQKKLPASWVG